MSSRWSGLAKRVVSALALAGVSMSLIWWGVLPFAFEVCLLALAGTAEFFELAERKNLRPLRRTGTLVTLALLCTAVFAPPGWLAHALVCSFLLFMIVVVSRGPVRVSTFMDACATWMGVLYVGWLFAYVILIRRLDHGAFLLTWLVVTVAATDIGAYFVGRQFGRRPLWASVSPKKTLEGSAGGVLFSMLASWAFCHTWQSAVLGLVVSVVGQLGDLWESALKRDVGVKDTGDLIGGHGGVLDRFDSLAFAAPVFYLYFTL